MHVLAFLIVCNYIRDARRNIIYIFCMCVETYIALAIESPLRRRSNIPIGVEYVCVCMCLFCVILIFISHSAPSFCGSANVNKTAAHDIRLNNISCCSCLYVQYKQEKEREKQRHREWICTTFFSYVMIFARVYSQPYARTPYTLVICWATAAAIDLFAVFFFTFCVLTQLFSLFSPSCVCVRCTKTNCVQFTDSFSTIYPWFSSASCDEYIQMYTVCTLYTYRNDVFYHILCILKICRNTYGASRIFCIFYHNFIVRSFAQLDVAGCSFYVLNQFFISLDMNRIPCISQKFIRLMLWANCFFRSCFFLMSQHIWTANRHKHKNPETKTK